MKNKSLPKALVALFVACLMSYFFISCKDVETTPQQEQQKLEGLSNSNFLEFKDGKEFIEKLNEVSKMKKEQLDEWEKSKGFMSMRSIYEAILDKELKIIEDEEQKIKEHPSLKLTLKHKFSDLYENNKDIIKLTDFGFEINIHDLAYATLVNRDGIVKIGSVIHQFSKDKVKFVKSGDENKISSLNSFKSDGVFNDVEVKSIKTNRPLIQQNARPNWTGRCDSDDGSYWLTGWFETSQVPMSFNGSDVTSVRTTITSRHLRHTWLGWIDHNTTSYSANGSFSLSTNGSFPLVSSGYLTNKGYSFNLSAWAGNTAQAQYGLTDDLIWGHYSYWVFTIDNSSTNFNFLNQSCSVNY